MSYREQGVKRKAPEGRAAMACPSRFVDARAARFIRYQEPSGRRFRLHAAQRSFLPRPRLRNMPSIQSPHNPRVKRAVKLRDRRQRSRQGRFLIDGARELLRAWEAGVAMEEVFVCGEYCRTTDALEVLARLDAEAPQIRFDVPEAVLEKIAFGERNEGLVAVAITPSVQLADLPPAASAAIVVLEGVEKPGNLGAVARTADATGMSALVVTGDGATDLYNPNAIRASLGTLFALPVCAATAEETIAWLRRHNIAMFAARVEGSVAYTAADFRQPCAIVLGSEAKGLSPAWQGPDVTAIRLPMLGVADSLNVSVTAAVLCYELLRQRDGAPADGEQTV